MNRLFLIVLTAGTLVGLSPVTGATSRGVPVPKALRGRWAADFKPIVEPCDPKYPEDFKWSFTADRAGFDYWEAKATPSVVRRISTDRYVVDLLYVGEGETWRERRSFRLTDHGRTLIVDKAEPSLGLRQLRYRRCD